MSGLGSVFLKQSFDILANQTFKDFDVIISDHSKNDLIEKLCNEYNGKLKINYYKNDENIGSSSANINNALDKADGKIIKILFQDDFLYNNDSLKEIVDNFDLNNDNWLLTSSICTKDGINFLNPFYPKYNRFIQLGLNTISSPSVLAIKNKDHLLFDKNLIWLMDCDYYKMCFNKFGQPKILKEINVVNRIGAHQVSKKIVKLSTRIKEWLYILNKYK
jgi:hypothetical protein